MEFLIVLFGKNDKQLEFITDNKLLSVTNALAFKNKVIIGNKKVAS